MIKIISNITADFLKNKIGVYDEGIDIMLHKTKVYNIFLGDISNQAASILKQDMLSIGGDVAVNADVVRYKTGNNSCLVIGTKKHFRLLNDKLKKQPFGLQNIANEIEQVLLNCEHNNYSLKLKSDRILDLSDTKIMGILNLTPDSFSDGGKFFNNIDVAVDRALKMIDEGVDILDLGAESTRPGAESVSCEEEIKRLLPVLKAIRKNTKTPISVDTYKAEVARVCLEAGADIINDISAFGFDDNMVKVAAKHESPIVLMHMQNTPKNMQKNPQYSDVVDEILEYLAGKIKFARENGVKSEKIIVDPGLGFGKTTENNLEILRRIDEFKSLGCPILVGASRKAFVGSVLDVNLDERLVGSLAVSAFLAEKKINILRVHDIKEHKQTVEMIKSVIK